MIAVIITIVVFSFAYCRVLPESSTDVSIFIVAVLAVEGIAVWLVSAAVFIAVWPVPARTPLLFVVAAC